MMKGGLVVIYMTQMTNLIGSGAKVIGIIIEYAYKLSEVNAKLHEGV
jgi:predicted peptidase